MTLQVDAPDLKTGFGRAAFLGMLAAVVMIFGAALWSYFTQINGAVIAQGAVEVASRPKSVQHLDGGIINEILIANGEAVEAGDVLMRLDDTLLSANLNIYQTRLAEATVERDRLIAEQEGAESIHWSEPLLPTGEIDLDLLRSGEVEIFRSRADLQAGRRAQLEEKLRQFDNQIAGVNALVNAKQEQLTLLEKEVEAGRTLLERGLSRESQFSSLLRSQADLVGQIAEHTSEIARIENSIRDTELEILQTQRQFREEVVTQLRETGTTIQELSQQILSTQKQLDRVEVKSPTAGRIHELQFSTIAGVVPPGAMIVQVIPRDEELSFEVQIDPVFVDQVYPGQEATVRFPAFNQRTTPELNGSVLLISPTSVTDDATGRSFYRVTVQVGEEELARLGGLELLPGMPVEAYLQTGERSVLNYLTKPLVEQLNQAFRER